MELNPETVLMNKRDFGERIKPIKANSHEVIGQEFDYVLVVIDNNFRYDANGDLTAREHPNPEYLFPRLFYQNISRAREKLCIVVLNNKELFGNLLHIKCGE